VALGVVFSVFLGWQPAPRSQFSCRLSMRFGFGVETERTLVWCLLVWRRGFVRDRRHARHGPLVLTAREGAIRYVCLLA